MNLYPYKTENGIRYHDRESHIKHLKMLILHHKSQNTMDYNLKTEVVERLEKELDSLFVSDYNVHSSNKKDYEHKK